MPNEVAGISTNYAESLRIVGVNAIHYKYNQHLFGYENRNDVALKHPWIDISSYRIINSILKIFVILRIVKILKIILKYDIFYSISGLTFTRTKWDIKLAKKLGKKVVFHFVGCDLREPLFAVQDAHKNNGTAPCPFCPPSKYNVIQCWKGAERRELVKFVEKYGDIIYAGYSINQSINKRDNLISVLYGAVEIPEIDTEKAMKVPLILHAPTSPEMKGTKYVLEVIEKLKTEFEFEFILMEGKGNSEVKELLKKSVIVLDQFMLGIHGIFSTEAMAAGNAVLCYIRKDWEHYRPDLPIISTNKDEIYDNLKSLLQDKKKLKEICKRSREYAIKYHSFNAVGKRLEQDFMMLYENSKVSHS